MITCTVGRNPVYSTVSSISNQVGRFLYDDNGSICVNPSNVGLKVYAQAVDVMRAQILGSASTTAKRLSLIVEKELPLPVLTHSWLPTVSNLSITLTNIIFLKESLQGELVNLGPNTV